MTVIEIEHLSKEFQIPHEKRNTLFETLTGVLRPASYETFFALKDISFSVEEGEMLGIIGQNGSGKSTLLKILSRIIVPTCGTVRVKRQVTPFLELGVGFNRDFTAAENIRIYGIIMGLTPREIDEKTDEILEFAGMERFRDTKLRNFSSGMQVRLAFSTAIQTKPEILLLDEVLAVGDMDFQRKCLDVLERFKKEGVTIIFVSHELDDIAEHCTRAMLLDHGKLVMIGETRDVIARYESA
ncbi:MULTISPECIES: ABC transporter ATP-binding protein [unclassified Methanoregula]|uniref:ABC transporter ATP-binding protein n=1 Tax=unclassified Methanoregula TaxID=2649730 RepID=UPI0009D3D235|nr:MULTISPECIES: ABC transporter ATP-binding protein [unclassified Methanoregula]OPX65146.1 MAG: putative ABC transporter ATP-binding protein [Methanoregula sp. PtaB.Bin085]OPY32058.1 MAG: putative ABC transporter ATP-binding protein [Methanoregula sp. PtaU1.Bin006]